MNYGKMYKLPLKLKKLYLSSKCTVFTNEVNVEIPNSDMSHSTYEAEPKIDGIQLSKSQYDFHNYWIFEKVDEVT